MNLGDAFIFSLAVSSDEHIYFVAYAEGNPTSKLVLFNFTGHKPGACDETCIVKPYEYKRLSKDSVIGYRWGRIVDGVATIQALARSGVGTKLDTIPPAILTRIQAGALVSKFTPLKIKELLRPPASS
ncbi:MAG: hypothetical protein A4C66_15275 [Nitrospira sp. HN-bin3]|uniref:hypothetical protein n=1 Tax=Nitrospira cf. moscoviensis SBR1015 TaxID=96242 RepID=UPI000A0CCC02|nr:hypothetical protein [Nitrospira cf. moscoviensis SBR1015]OQW44755.1 MAG: hypothetical protein A4C66_15275 [Nitrospira sp. HN-bin3]